MPRHSWRKRVERGLGRAVAATTVAWARALPLPGLRALADAAAWLLRRLAPSRQRVAVANLRGVFGDQYTDREYRRLAAAATRNLCRTMAELFKQPYLSRSQLERLVQVEGLEHLRAALAGGRGAILLSAHFGNWEILGPRLVAAGLPTSVVARDAPDAGTARLINQCRERCGLQVVSRRNVRGMLEALRAGRLLLLLPDQHQRGASVVVDFLGRPAATATGPATLARRTGAPVVPGFCRRLADGSFRVTLQPALELIRTGDRAADARANTAHYNQVLGDEIRRHPEQWLWLHRRFKPLTRQKENVR